MQPSYRPGRAASQTTRSAPGWWWCGSLGWPSWAGCCRQRRRGGPSGGGAPLPSPLWPWRGSGRGPWWLRGDGSASWHLTATVEHREGNDDSWPHWVWPHSVNSTSSWPWTIWKTPNQTILLHCSQSLLMFLSNISTGHPPNYSLCGLSTDTQLIICCSNQIITLRIHVASHAVYQKFKYKCSSC